MTRHSTIRIKKQRKEQKAIRGSKYQYHRQITNMLDISLFKKMEDMLMRFFERNPKLGKLHSLGRSESFGRSWYYVVDTTGHLKEEFIIRISDHSTGKVRSREELTILCLEDKPLSEEHMINIIMKRMVKRIPKGTKYSVS